MSDDHPVPDLITRRALLSTLGVTAGAGALLAALPGGTATAAGSAGAGSPNALGGNVSGLTYLQLDALAFFTALTGGVNGRYSDSTSGTGAVQSGQPLSAALPIPVGSVVRQLNFSYQGTPSVFIYRRPLANPQSEQAFVNATLAAGGGPKTQTVTDGLPLTIEADNTYSLRINVAPGDSIYGVTVGYQPPTQGFVPFSGANPRVYDSRPIGKLADGEERLVPLGLAGARGAVVNLTLTRTTGGSGYVAVFAGGIPWPGNSSQNWYAAGANVANCVVTAVDAQGRITIRGGENPTDVIVDVIGYLY